MAHSPVCFVTTIDLSLKDKLEQDLLKQGFSLSPAPYAFFTAKKEGLSCNLYQSGKLTVQGKNKDDFIAFYLEPEILKNLSYTHPEASVDMTAHIGLDEAGKGDFFGPLCVAALYAGDGQAKELLELGVQDSKKISDAKVISLSKKLKASFPHEVIRFLPETYNRLYDQFKNLNKMLAWGHATVLEKLVEKTSCKTAILDQFASEHVMTSLLKRKNLNIDLTQRFKGEEDPVVAAASILARAAFLEGLEELRNKYQIDLPKGASSTVITAARSAIAKHGPSILPLISKSHFKTTQALVDA